jgi:drug/metabolite transporter (DMT)-like permease
MAAMAAVSVAGQPPSATPAQWAAFAYLGVVSMFLGFFAWYRGLAIGPMAQVSQVQLVQPVLSICWAGLILGENLGWSTLIGGAAVVFLAGLAVRTRPFPRTGHGTPAQSAFRTHSERDDLRVHTRTLRRQP